MCQTQREEQQILTLEKQKQGFSQHHRLMNNFNNDSIIKIAAEGCTNYVTSTDK